MLGELQRVFESGGDEVSAVCGQRAHEEFEGGACVGAALEERRCHGEFVKVGEQRGAAAVVLHGGLDEPRCGANDNEIRFQSHRWIALSSVRCREEIISEK